MTLTYQMIIGPRPLHGTWLTMVSAWLFDGVPGDQRLPHKREGSQEISLEKLAELGVLYWKVE